MLSEKEKGQIRERIIIEEEIRKEIRQELDIRSKTGEDSSIPKRFSWLNSKVVLLLLGGIITGGLVPWFQYTQKTLEWKRQNQSDNVRFHLTKMRSCLEEFVYLSTYNAEAYERVKPFFDKIHFDVDIYESFEKQFIELQNERYRQNAKVISLLIYFRNAPVIQGYFSEFVNHSTDYLRDCQEYVRLLYCRSNPIRCEKEEVSENDLMQLQTRIMRYTGSIEDAYRRFVAEVKREIGMVEDESKKMRL